MLNSADRTRTPELRRLSAESGFYDQPHLIQEMHAWMGRSPTRLHEERRLQQIR